MNITIRKACPNDAEALLSYLKQIGGETDNLSFGAEGVPFSAEAEKAYIAGMEHSSDQIMLLAMNGTQIVGDASLSRSPRRMSHRGELGIAVLKEYWNRGIGAKLLEEIIAFASQNDFEIIDLQVRSDNHAAIHLYEKYGFQRLGTHPAFFNLNGNNIPFDYMYLSLRNI